MAGIVQESLFINEWKDKMKRLINLRYGNKDLSKHKVDAYLNNVLEEKLHSPNVTIINNYTNVEVKSDILSTIDLIRKNNLIIGGAGVLYCQHGLKRNVLLGYIKELKTLRNHHKSMRKTFEKCSFGWIMQDIFQGKVKTKTNALYGVHGYVGFQLYNRFIAEAITNCGRQIICTAVMAFENFLAGGVQLNTEGELYLYIDRISAEYTKKYSSKIDCSIFHFDDIDTAVMKRLISKCSFNVTDEFIISLQDMISNLSYEEKVMIYYKNNLYEFSSNQFILDKLRYVVNTLDNLRSPNIESIEDASVVDVIKDIDEFYEVFVIYDYPIYDRVRKAMYTDRSAVLYVDTDSNFLALDKWVRFIKGTVLGCIYNKPEREVDFIAVNLMTIFLGNVINKALHTLCRYMNITEKYADMLKMKNEFYLERILFTNVKKRYTSNAILQEGELLRNGEGMAEIKGFDFKKSVTKPFVTKYFTDICLNDILRVKEINVENIFQKMLLLQKDIEESMKNGESKYYKQANIQNIEYYKRPYSTQGIRAVIFWNCVCPEYAMDLPTDLDIIPTIDIGGAKTKKGAFKNQKNITWFKSQYPEAYKRIEAGIYNNPNPLIANMSLTYIAKPKNTDIQLPEWFSSIVNTEKIVLDTLKLFYPILESLGLKLLKTNASTHYMTNIVEL